MDHRAAYLIQILEKLGSPLMVAIIQGSTQFDEPAKNAETAAAQDAQKMASLLAKTVRLGIDIGNTSDLAKAGIHDDSIRVALTALAGPLIARQYLQNGKIPSEAEIKRFIPALQAVMAFSDNFEPSAQNAERLKGLSADANQFVVQYLQAFTPVLNALATFSFGQSEQKLIMDVSARLTQKAKTLGEAILGSVPEDERQKAELAVLNAIAPVYAACHEAETARLMTLQREDFVSPPPLASGGDLSLARVWEAFEIRISMLEALAHSVMSAEESASQSSISDTRATEIIVVDNPVAAPLPAPLPEPEPVKSSFVPLPESAPALSRPAPPLQVRPLTGASPMSVFGRPNADVPPLSAKRGGSRGDPMSFFSIPLKKGDGA